jgi:hypothetical protein
LRSARRDAIAHGLPTAAWAGVSLMGNGDLTVTPEAGASHPLGPWTLGIALLFLLLALPLALAIWMKRRRHLHAKS